MSRLLTVYFFIIFRWTDHAYIFQEYGVCVLFGEDEMLLLCFRLHSLGISLSGRMCKSREIFVISCSKMMMGDGGGGGRAAQNKYHLSST